MGIFCSVGKVFALGTGHATKTDEFLKKFQTAFDPPPQLLLLDYEEDHECHLHTNGQEGIRQLLMFTFISYFQIFWLKSSLYEQNICHVTLKHK